MINSETLYNSHFDSDNPEFSVLKGKTFLSVDKTEDAVDNDMIVFACKDNTKYVMMHRQDCCESVYIEDICGDLNDLVGSEIVHAEMETNCNRDEEYNNQGEYDNSFTWTFYHLRTHKGDVTIRWYGTSNGYYSERVDFFEIKE